MSSVRELESRNAGDRKKLIQAAAQYLARLGIKSRLVVEPVLDLLGTEVGEPTLQIKDQSIQTIRLAREVNVSCSGPDLLRFQFIFRREEVSGESPVYQARTRTIKTGRFLGLFGGKTAGATWVGAPLADILNRDAEVNAALQHAIEVWGEPDLAIRVTPAETAVSGPWFVNPSTIAALFAPGRQYAELECVFSYPTAARIIQITGRTAFNAEFTEQGVASVTNQS